MCSYSSALRIRRTRIEKDIVNVLVHYRTQLLFNDLGPSKTIVHKILQVNKMYPYHISSYEILKDSGYDSHWLLYIVYRTDCSRIQ